MIICPTALLRWIGTAFSQWLVGPVDMSLLQRQRKVVDSVSLLVQGMHMHIRDHNMATLRWSACNGYASHVSPHTQTPCQRNCHLANDAATVLTQRLLQV